MTDIKSKVNHLFTSLFWHVYVYFFSIGGLDLLMQPLLGEKVQCILILLEISFPLWHIFMPVPNYLTLKQMVDKVSWKDTTQQTIGLELQI